MIEDDDGGVGRPDGGDAGDSNAGEVNDSYNISNDDFKEEDDTDGADLGSDLPEFLQQASGNYPHSSFPGSSFQPVSSNVPFVDNKAYRS